MDKDKIKEILKSGRAGAMAIAVALVVSNPLALTGCTKQTDKDKDDQQQQSSGGSSGGWFFHSSGSSSSSSDGSSWSSSSHSSEGGYSGAHGGTSAGE